ncbi:MAG: WG repeat-containing protein, partial [Acetivibrio ethanolgignens]
MSNFDWLLAYDESPVFKQGIAIVRRYGKFGAVMVGGKEIVPPIYDALSEFKDGYAVAKWNNEERVVNLSGQIRVLKGNKEIFLPEEYDWGFDFIEDICVVVKNGKYGIIDFNFNVKHDCEYDSFTNYHNGYAIFSKDRWSEWSDNAWSDDFLIDNKGIVSYKIEESFADDHKIVCCIDNQQNLYGVMDSNMQIIIPIIYTQINRLKNGLYVADSKDGVKLFLDSEDGEIISKKVVDDIVDISKHFFCTYKEDKIQKKWETSIYTSP